MVEYKNTIIERLSNNQNILKAAYYQNKDFLDKPDVSIEEVLYKNIYPYNFIPSDQDNSENKKTYLTFNQTSFRPAKSQRFRSCNLVFNVFTHRDLFQTDYGILRVDFLVSEIDELFDGVRGIGIGQLEFASMNELYINNAYTGYQIIYRPVDFSDRR